jgi:hypothetical protein
MGIFVLSRIVRPNHALHPAGAGTAIGSRLQSNSWAEFSAWVV